MLTGVSYRYENGIIGFALAFIEFRIGGAAWIATPAFQTTVEPRFYQRCLQIHVAFILFFVEFNIPLWLEGV